MREYKQSKFLLLLNHLFLFGAVLLVCACGSTESLNQADVLGSYLYVDELNIAPKAPNQVHIACKRANGDPLTHLAANISINKIGVDLGMISQDWLEVYERGEQAISFTLDEPGTYTLALQLKPIGSNKTFFPKYAYTIVQVLDEKEVGSFEQSQQSKSFHSKPLQAITRGTSIHTQLLLLDSKKSLQQEEVVIRFQSSDNLALLPGPIRLAAKDGGNKLVLNGVKLYGLGEQTVLAIEEGTERIVSEQHYHITLGPKTVYRPILNKPQIPTIADGIALAQVQLVLTDGVGEPINKMQVVLAIDQGSRMHTIPAQTDKDGRANFSWSETVAGSRFLELFLLVPTGMIPILQDSILFVPGAPARLRFIESPRSTTAGKVLLPTPTVQVVDALDNEVLINDISVTLTLASNAYSNSVHGSMDGSLLGETTILLQDGKASFPQVALSLANVYCQLEAIGPGLLAGQSLPFTISPAQPEKLAFVEQPKTGLALKVDNPIRVALQDSFGNLVPQDGLVVDLTLGPNQGSWHLIYPTSAITVAGIADFNGATNASGQNLFLEARAPEYIPAISNLFDVTTGPPDALLSQAVLVSAGPIVANDKDTHRVKVTLVDETGTPIVGLSVQAQSILGQTKISYPFGSLSDNDGIVWLDLRSTFAGEQDVLVQMGPTNKLLQPKPIFLPGTPQQANLRLSQTSLVLDGASYLTITGRLEDSYGNVLANIPYTLVSNELTDSITPPLGTTDAQGKLVAQWRGTLVTNQQRELQIQSQNYTSSPIQATFLPGSPSLLYSKLTISPNPGIADGQSVMVLEARIADDFNNPIPNLQVLFGVSGRENLLLDALVYTDALSGIARANLRSTASQDKEVVIRLKSITLQETATFLPIPCLGKPILSLKETNTQSIHTDNNPSDVIFGDFNQDAIMDLAVLSDNGIGIFIGQLDNGFKPQVNYPSSSNTDLTALDANLDGITDLVAIGFKYGGSSTIGILLGRRDGTFQPEVTYPISSSGRSAYLTVLDINRDGIMDLVVVDEGGTFNVFHGIANGTFQLMMSYSTEQWFLGLTTLDANRDGIGDLAFTNFLPSTLDIWLGKNDGSFEPGVSQSTGGFARDPTTLDANRDGIVDLAVVEQDGFSIFLGRGDGSLKPGMNYQIGGTAYDLTLLDANQDGIADLLVLDDFYGTFTTFLGQGDGTFEKQSTYPTGRKPLALTTLDTNRDGIVDLAVSNSAVNSIDIFLGQANGNFGGQVNYAIVRPPIALAQLDINRDGKIDLAVISDSSNLDIFIGQDDGTFGEQMSYPTVSQPQAFTVLDVNGDGIDDLAVVNYYSDLGILIGRADGGLEPQVVYSVDMNYPSDLTSLDANRDGVTDLAITGGFVNNKVGIMLGQVNGEFSPPIKYSTGDTPRNIVTFDANLDGIVDLAVVNFRSDNVGLFIGQSNGSFSAQVTYPTGDGPMDLASLDVNRDGVTDLAISDYFSSTLSILIGRPNGTFVPQVSYVSAEGIQGLKVMDINQDNIQDVFVYGDKSGLHIGLSDGSFLPVIGYENAIRDVLVGDFDQDYIPELVVLSGNGLKVINRLDCEP